jgi:hypothetical protein
MISGSFRNLIRDFLTPDSAEVSLGFLKTKYSDNTKVEIRKMLAAIRGRRVLFAEMGHEIWEYVFKSLHELREMFIELSGQLTTATSREIKPSIDFLTDVVVSYLAEYETSYITFMSGPQYPEMAIAHKERNWPDLGVAAEDLIALRKLIFAALRQLNAFAEGQDIEDFTLPEDNVAQFWVRYARDRTFCPKCGFNMYYAPENICPSCFPEKISGWGAWRGKYGRA